MNISSADPPIAEPSSPVASGPAPTEPPSLPPASLDLAGGQVDPAEGRLIDDEIRDRLADNKSFRWMRWAAFAVFGVTCITLLIVVVWSLHSLFVDRETLAIVATAHDWHYLTFLSVVVIAMAAVPLSLCSALIKMVSKAQKDDVAFSLTTPQVEVVKMIVQMFHR
jgi:hypothetical protein